MEIVGNEMDKVAILRYCDCAFVYVKWLPLRGSVYEVKKYGYALSTIDGICPLSN